MFQNKEVTFDWMEILSLFVVALIITAIISFFTM